jgi:hypothetical protein
LYMLPIKAASREANANAIPVGRSSMGLEIHT